MGRKKKDDFKDNDDQAVVTLDDFVIESKIEAFCRTYKPFLLIIPLFFGLRGVFVAAPVSDTVSAILAAVLLKLDLKKLR